MYGMTPLQATSLDPPGGGGSGGGGGGGSGDGRETVGLPC